MKIAARGCHGICVDLTHVPASVGGQNGRDGDGGGPVVSRQAKPSRVSVQFSSDAYDGLGILVNPGELQRNGVKFSNSKGMLYFTK